MKLLTLTGVAALALAACAPQAADTAYLTGSVDDYPGKGYLSLINLENRGEAYDTLDVQPDGTFFVEVPTTKNTVRGLYTEYLEDNRGITQCYLKPGDTLRVDLKGGMQEQTFFGETVNRYVSTPTFTGSAARESEYLNLPPFYNYQYVHEDGSAVSFRDFMAQVEEQQNFRRSKLESCCEEFVAEQTPEIDGMKNQYSFPYFRHLRFKGHDAGEDADFMAFVNSIDVNDPAGATDDGYGSLISDLVEFKLEHYPTLYADEPSQARFYCFVRDSIQNQAVREALVDESMRIYMAMGSDDQLKRVFEIYKSISDTSKVFKENETVYNNLARLLPGVKATDFEMQDVEGNTVRFLDVIGQGKVTYIDFWATWCGPCCAEIPYIETLVEKYKNNPKIEFLSISLDNDLKKWHQKLDKDNPTWRQYIIPENFESAFAKEYNITAIPRFMVFDGEGCIITINAERPSNPEIESILNGYLK